VSKNALALVDCNNRTQLFQLLVEKFDRKAVKNEMVSPYDDQLIGKMNFRYGGMEHAMFFTYARASEYPGMRFHNHRILYLSLGVNEISSDIFNQICAFFGGFVDYDDDLDNGWQKIQMQRSPEDEAFAQREWPVEETRPHVSQQAEIRQILKLDRSGELLEEKWDEKSRHKESKNERRNPDYAKSERKNDGRKPRNERRDSKSRGRNGRDRNKYKGNKQERIRIDEEL